METQTTFDLNLAIRRWREDLAHSSAFRNENLNELESHLRDSIDRLRTRELSDEEAFLIATRRVGNTQRLEQEFGKVNAAAVWFDRCLWVLVAVQLWGLILSTSRLLFTLALPACAWLNEILPGFGLQKFNVDWMQTGLAMGFSPLLVAIAALLMWRYFIWPESRGAALLQKLLRRPGVLASSLFLVCILFKCAAIEAMRNLNPVLAHDAFNREVQTRVFLFSLPPLMLWAALTFFFARKRLRSRVA